MDARICRNAVIFRVFFILLLAASCFGPWAESASRVDEPRISRVELAARDGWLEIDADVNFELAGPLRDAASRGVPLYFTADLAITSERWWWFDKEVANTSITWRSVYNTLTRQWRAGAGELTLPVDTLDQAMDIVRRVRNWRVIETARLDASVRYEGRMRVRLDTSMLARPFQVNALNSSSWSPATPWADFSFALSRLNK
jgi:hypothetical protein